MSVILQSSVSLRCEICGADDCVVLCSPQVVARHYARRRAFFAALPRLSTTAHPVPERPIFTDRYGAEIVSCRLCGVVMRDPQPTGDALAAAIDAEKRDIASLWTLHEAELSQGRLDARRLKRWMRPGARVVEIGPSAGGFLASAHAAGWDARGVGVSKQSEQFCRARGQCVVSDSIDCARIEPGSVDCVAAWGTFAAVRDPAAALVAVVRALRPGGLFAVRIPNGEYFRRGLESIFAAEADGDHRRAEMCRRGLMWNDLYGFPYLWGYSANSLDALLHQQGFVRIALRGCTLAPLTPPTVSAHALDERFLKLRQQARLCCALLGRPEAGAAPWLEAVYRLA